MVANHLKIYYSHHYYQVPTSRDGKKGKGRGPIGL